MPTGSGIIFSSTLKTIYLAKLLFYAVFVLLTAKASAQRLDSIYVNLYTDSLKKGTYNYINIDGQFSNGSFIPLDSTDLIFRSSAGKFYGNSLLVDHNFEGDKINISVTSRKNPALHKEFDIYVKKKTGDEQLKTVDELLNDMKPRKSRKKS